MKKVLFTLTLVFLVLCSVFAQSVPEKKTSDQSVTLRFMWWGSDSRHQATLGVIRQYEELHPNVKIEAEYGGYDGYFEKLATQLSGGTAPDIIQYNANSISDLMAIGDIFVDLRNYSDVLDTTTFDEGFLKSFSYWGGKMIALPTGINSGIWLVNTALLDEAGLKVEDIKTWDDFIAAGIALHEYNSNYYLFNFDIDTLGKELLGSIMAQLTGKDLINKETMTVNFTEQDLLKVFKLFRSMYENNVLEPAEDSAPYALKLATNPKWINHELCLMYGATSNVYNGYYNFFDTAVAMPMPEFEDAKESGILYIPPQMIAVSSSSTHPEVAADFLNYFYNNETAINTLKVSRSIQPTAFGREICDKNGYADPVLVAAINEGAKTCTENQNLYTPSEVVAILKDATEKIAYNQGSVETIASSTYDAIVRVLKTY